VRQASLRSVAERALFAAEKAGARYTDLIVIESEERAVRVRCGKIEGIEQQSETAIGLRVFVDTPKGLAFASASTHRTDEEGIARTAAKAVAMAKIAAVDPEAVPPIGAPHPSEEELRAWLAHQAPVEPWPIEEAKVQALEAEAAALAVPGVHNSEGAEAAWSRARIAYASSDGFVAEYEKGHWALSVAAVAERNREMQRDYAWHLARSRDALPEAAKIGREAGERAAKRLGAAPPPTGNAPVVFEPRVAVSLLGHLAQAVNGRAVLQRRSFLADRLGEAIFPSFVQIVDDPAHPDGTEDRLFDGEGVRCRRLTLVKDGVLQSWLLNRYLARRLGMESTGHAARGLTGDIGVSPSNLIWQPGDETPEQILRRLDRGFFVTELIGFGVDPTSGVYSRGAAGFWFENGTIVRPVQGATIAGNLAEIFASIAAVGSDLQWFGSRAAPTIAIEQMTIAGRG